MFGVTTTVNNYIFAMHPRVIKFYLGFGLGFVCFNLLLLAALLLVRRTDLTAVVLVHALSCVVMVDGSVWLLFVSTSIRDIVETCIAIARWGARWLRVNAASSQRLTEYYMHSHTP